MEIDQLLLSKVLFMKGQEFLKNDDEISCGIAVSLFQDSSEMLLRAIAKHVDADVGENDKYMQFWDKIKKAPKGNDKDVPKRAQMTEVNKARVNFKHYGHTPNPKLAVRLGDYTENFMRESMSLFFNVNYDNVSMADRIANINVRDKIKDAEQSYKDEEYENCIVSCAVAEILATVLLDKILPSSVAERQKYTLYDTSSFDLKLKEVIDALLSDFSNQRMLILTALLNISITDYIKFKNITPHVNLTNSGKEYIHFGRQTNFDDKDSIFCLNFVINYALAVEKTIENIEQTSLYKFYDL